MLSKRLHREIGPWFKMAQSITFHVVPWYNSEEWLKAYNNLINVETDIKEEALKMMLVWKARCPALPSGIESTLGLLHVYIEDKKKNKADREGSDQLLRLAYSTAIMRFVNHMLDSETEKGKSLYKAAKTLGVPDWIVDLRHETAHSSTLPPLSLLREATCVTLQWLQDNYWDKHKPYIKDYTSGQKDIIFGDGTVTALINCCISLGICSLPNLNIKVLSEIPDIGMRDSLINDTKELFGNLVNVSDLSGVPITSLINFINAHSKRLLQVKDISNLVNEALLGEDSLFLSRELLYFFSASDFKYKNKLYSNYVQCFEILLTFLHTNDLLLDFLLELIKLTQSTSCYFKGRLAALWCSEILAALKNCNMFLLKFKRMKVEGDSSKKTLKKLFNDWFPDKQTNLTLNLLKDAPPELKDIAFIQPIITEYNMNLTYYVRDLLGLLEPALPTEVTERVCALTTLISKPDKYPTSRTTNIFTADDVESNDEVVIVENAPNTENEQNEEQNINNIWKLASREYKWNTIPIGQVLSLDDLDKPN